MVFGPVVELYKVLDTVMIFEIGINFKLFIQMLT